MSKKRVFSPEEIKRAVDTYLRNGRDYNATYKELGYPSRRAMNKWFNQYLERNNLEIHLQERSPYTMEERKQAVQYYVQNYVSVKQAVQDLGYPSVGRLYCWLNEDAPEALRLRSPCNHSGRLLKCTPDEVQEAVIAMCQYHIPPAELAKKYGVSESTLYSWKRKFLSIKGRDVKHMPEEEKKISYALLNYLTKDREELLAEKEELSNQVGTLQEEVHRLQMERDALIVAGEILKKGQGVSLNLLKNREKAIAIDALKVKYKLNELLQLFRMAKSSYFYQKQAIQSPDKYEDLRKMILDEFQSSRSRYGYRRIHAKIKSNGLIVSEKVIRRLMKEDHLIAISPKKRHYNSYMGEITAATPNIVNRDFHADIPNEKWLTDITEFSIPAGKAYLSPIIDCFDGMVVSWTIGIRPSSELVNSMLINAASKLNEHEHPIVHSDRGNHYRWPHWIELMETFGLTRSMSRKGCSPDNSACEGFFGRLKNEMFYCRNWEGISMDDFISELHNYIVWYNQERIKMSLGAMSPVQYRKSLGLAV